VADGIFQAGRGADRKECQFVLCTFLSQGVRSATARLLTKDKSFSAPGLMISDGLGGGKK